MLPFSFMVPPKEPLAPPVPFAPAPLATRPRLSFLHLSTLQRTSEDAGTAWRAPSRRATRAVVRSGPARIHARLVGPRLMHRCMPASSGLPVASRRPITRRREASWATRSPSLVGASTLSRGVSTPLRSTSPRLSASPPRQQWRILSPSLAFSTSLLSESSGLTASPCGATTKHASWSRRMLRRSSASHT